VVVGNRHHARVFLELARDQRANPEQAWSEPDRRQGTSLNLLVNLFPAHSPIRGEVAD
jgi:hypothetical protein